MTESKYIEAESGIEPEIGEDIEVTREMLVYGKLELHRDRTVGDELIVARIYRAMELARRKGGSV